MANRSCGRGGQQQGRVVPVQTVPGVPTAAEPPVRRWPHPVNGVAPDQPECRQTDAALHYIRCALSYQNQLLADIKALLEKLTVDQAGGGEEK